MDENQIEDVFEALNRLPKLSLSVSLALGEDKPILKLPYEGKYVFPWKGMARNLPLPFHNFALKQILTLNISDIDATQIFDFPNYTNSSPILTFVPKR